jgi:hypothetical protein
VKDKIEPATLYECYAWRVAELDATALKVLELEQHGVTQFANASGTLPHKRSTKQYHCRRLRVSQPCTWSASPTIRHIRLVTTGMACGP